MSESRARSKVKEALRVARWAEDDQSNLKEGMAFARIVRLLLDALDEMDEARTASVDTMLGETTRVALGGGK